MAVILFSSHWSLTFEVRKSPGRPTGSLPPSASQWSLTFEVRKSQSPHAHRHSARPTVAMEPDL